MGNLSNLIMNFLNSEFFPFVVTFIIVGIVVGGMALMSGRRARDWAKEHLAFVVIGSALVYTATSLGPDFAAAFGW